MQTAKEDGRATGGAPASRVPPERIAPFIAWLATQIEDETTRRAYREVVEMYLAWCDGDGGSPQSRRMRFGAEFRHLPVRLVHEALARLEEHDAIVALTLPLEG